MYSNKPICGVHILFSVWKQFQQDPIQICSHCFATGPVCWIHRAPGAVRVFESFLLRVSSHGCAAAHQQPDRDPFRRLQDLQTLPKALLPSCCWHGCVAGVQKIQNTGCVASRSNGCAWTLHVMVLCFRSLSRSWVLSLSCPTAGCWFCHHGYRSCSRRAGLAAQTWFSGQFWWRWGWGQWRLC